MAIYINMKQTTKVRLIIFQILVEIYKKNRNFDEVFEFEVLKNNLEGKDKSFIFNVCLNTMRYNLHSKNIINKFVKKKLKTSQFILLSSAVTQIVFLNIKPYGVVNETVEVSKTIGLFPAFINAVLNKVSKEKNILKEIKVFKKIYLFGFRKNLKIRITLT